MTSDKLDARLEASIAAVEAVRDKLKPNNDKLAHLQEVAKKQFFATKESADAGNEMLAIPRRGSAFGVFAKQIELMNDGKAVSGTELYDILNSKINLFAMQASVKAQHEEFMRAGLDNTYFNGDADKEIEHKAAVKQLWELCEPAARARVLNTTLVNETMARVLQEALAKKEAKNENRKN